LRANGQAGFPRFIAALHVKDTQTVILCPGMEDQTAGRKTPCRVEDDIPALLPEEAMASVQIVDFA